MKFLYLSATVLLAAVGCDRVLDETHSDYPRIQAVLPYEGPSSGNFQVTLAGEFCPDVRVYLSEEGLGVSLPLVLATEDRVVVIMPEHRVGKTKLTAVCGEDRFALEPVEFTYFASSVQLRTSLISPETDRVLGFADFDGDGLDDLVGQFVQDNRVIAFHSVLGGEISDIPLATIRLGLEEGLVDADFADRDGDGLADITLIRHELNHEKFEVTIGLSSDKFQHAAIQIIGGRDFTTLAGVADLDADGDVDFLYTDGSELMLLRSGENSERVSIRSMPALLSARTMHGDFNADGVEDVAWSEPAFTVGTVGIFLGSRTHNYVLTSTRIGDRSVFFDADGDTWPDVLSFEGSSLVIRSGEGLDNLEVVSRMPANCRSCSASEVQISARLDLDGDEHSDYVVNFGDGPAIWESGTGDYQIVAEEAELLGVAQLVSGAPPAVIYDDGLVRAAYPVGRSRTAPSGPLVLRDLPPVIPSLDWTCFGTKNGEQIAFGIAGEFEPQLLLREQTATGELGPEEVREITGAREAALEPGYLLCDQLESTEEEAVFVVWGHYQRPPFALRFLSDGTISAVELPAETGATENPTWVSRNSVITVRGTPVTTVDVYQLENGVFQKTESGEFFPPSPDAIATPAFLGNDALIDVVLSHADGVTLLFGAPKAPGALEFRSEELDAELKGVSTVKVLDLDADGDLDLAVETRRAPATIQIYLDYEGDGTLRRTQELRRLFGMSVFQSCDLDLDGRLDLLLAGEGVLGYMRYIPNEGYGELETFDTLSASMLSMPSWSECTDLNGDSLPDIIFPEPFLGTMHTILNRSR